MSKKPPFIVNYLQFWEKLMCKVYFQKKKIRSLAQQSLLLLLVQIEDLRFYWIFKKESMKISNIQMERKGQIHRPKF